MGKVASQAASTGYATARDSEVAAKSSGCASAEATSRKQQRPKAAVAKADKKTADMLEEVRMKIQNFESERRKTLSCKYQTVQLTSGAISGGLLAGPSPSELAPT